MALISPILDNRTYAQLREELIRRIPTFTSEWTNHNESDAGITLLELFASLGESLLYRFNQIPDTTKVEFLRLLGVRPRPARPAQVMLAAASDEPAGVQVLKGTPAAAGAIMFETDDETYVWPLEVLAAGKTRQPPDDTVAGRESSEDALARVGLTAEQAQFYRTTVVSADPLADGAVTVDVSAQVDGALWVALLGKPTTALGALAGQTVFLGLAFDEQADRLMRLETLPDGGAAAFRADELTSPPPPMIWRLWRGPETGGLELLEVLQDSTRGLTGTGVVKVQLPNTLTAPSGPGDGGSDAPPLLDDAELAARVLAWLQVSRPDSADVGDDIGRVRWVGVNAVLATQLRTAPTELLGTGTGDAEQRYALSQRPVLAGSLVLQVEEPSGWVPWTEVETFVSSTVQDRHYHLDPDSGTILFPRTRVPQIGERIRVLSYRHGGGSVGNVAAGAVTALLGAGNVEVGNPLPAAGGADAVSLTEALDAIPAEVHRRDRAVVPDDFRELATQVSGVARAETLTLLHPDTPLVAAAGVISVVVFPDQDLRNPQAPMPELGLLKRTAQYLDARRLLTTELYVIPPEYLQVALSVGVRVKDGYQVDAVRRWVEQILRQYLAPTPPYGPGGLGWPLGRAVRRAELEAVAVQVDGVEYLEGLLLGVLDGGSIAPRDLVELERWQVPEIAQLSVVAGPPLAPGAEYLPTPPPLIPVPLPVDVC